MLYDIKRYNSPNFESRGKYKPVLIVNHITDGAEAVRRDDEHEETAVYNTFMNPACQASSTLTITRDGRIKQFVDIVNAAWTQGLGGPGAEKLAKNPIVREMGWRTNLYCLSIEYDAWGPNGGDGNITEAQFWAGVWAHKWLQKQVMESERYGYKIQLNSTYVTGHCHVDPVHKPMCPGVNFPWARMYQELAIADSMSLEDYEGRMSYLRSDKAKLKKCVDVWNEVDYLKDCADGLYGEGIKHWGLSLLGTLYAAFDTLGILKDVYSETDDYTKFHGHVVYIYNCAMGKDKPELVGWGIEMMAKAHPYMLQNGLVPAAV